MVRNIFYLIPLWLRGIIGYAIPFPKMVDDCPIAEAQNLVNFGGGQLAAHKQGFLHFVCTFLCGYLVCWSLSSCCETITSDEHLILSLDTICFLEYQDVLLPLVESRRVLGTMERRRLMKK